MYPLLLSLHETYINWAYLKSNTDPEFCRETVFTGPAGSEGD